MAADEQLDQLSRQLSKQSLGPIDRVADEATSRLVAACGAVISSLRQAAYDRPLMTLLLAGCDNEYWPTCADEYWPTPRCLIC